MTNKMTGLITLMTLAFTSGCEFDINIDGKVNDLGLELTEGEADSEADIEEAEASLDENEIDDLFTACDEGDEVACEELDRYLEEEMGLEDAHEQPEDDHDFEDEICYEIQETIFFLEGECWHGDEIACEELDLVFEEYAQACIDEQYDTDDFIDVEWDEYVAKLEEACADGDEEACEELAFLEEEWEDVDWSTYVEELEEACFEGDEDACEELEYLNEDCASEEERRNEETHNENEEEETDDEETEDVDVVLPL